MGKSVGLREAMELEWRRINCIATGKCGGRMYWKFSGVYEAW
ncbi:hypothetical protein [Caldivirga sp.]|nr:hypothetical protein [Caldivirga sp.]